MHLKRADGMTNSADLDQAASSYETGPAVWSESTLFAQTCLSKYLRPLQFVDKKMEPK